MHFQVETSPAFSQVWRTALDSGNPLLVPGRPWGLQGRAGSTWGLSTSQHLPLGDARRTLERSFKVTSLEGISPLHAVSNNVSQPQDPLTALFLSLVRHLQLLQPSSKTEACVGVSTWKGQGQGQSTAPSALGMVLTPATGGKLCPSHTQPTVRPCRSTFLSAGVGCLRKTH